jgi:hypothetical protein
MLVRVLGLLGQKERIRLPSVSRRRKVPDTISIKKNAIVKGSGKLVNIDEDFVCVRCGEHGNTASDCTGRALSYAKHTVLQKIVLGSRAFTFLG